MLKSRPCVLLTCPKYTTAGPINTGGSKHTDTLANNNSFIGVLNTNHRNVHFKMKRLSSHLRSITVPVITVKLDWPENHIVSHKSKETVHSTINTTWTYSWTHYFWFKYDLGQLWTPDSTRLGFELMTSRSWQHIPCHWDACSNHSAISYPLFKQVIWSTEAILSY